MNTASEKILPLEDLVALVRDLQKKGKVIVQSHGIFDLIHPGIIRHLEEAKSHGDVLIATVLKDKDVRRGPGRPIFPQDMRAKNLAALQIVDYVSVVDDEVPFECVKRVKPDVFAKGQAYKKKDRITFGKVFEEERDLYFEKTRIVETAGFSFSSSQIINQFLEMYPDETRIFLQRFRARHTFEEIASSLDALKGLKVLLVGDGIIDEYHYTQVMNKALKSLLVVNRYLSHEVFAGGAFAIANHLAGLVSEIQLVSLLGKEDSREQFVRQNLLPSVHPRFVFREDGPTIVKKRYLNQYLNQKLFEVNYLNDEFVKGETEAAVVRHIREAAPGCDLVLVSDFGHGLVTPAVIQALQETGKPLAVNAQTNGANAGYNLITKYQNPHFVCIDEVEVRLAAQDRFAPIDDVACRVARTIASDCLIVTLGKRGSIGVDRDGSVNRTPIFSTRVVDTVGAGDAFFAFTAPCYSRGMPMDLVSFIGNSVGALAVQIVCNKKPVEKHELLEFIHALLR